MDRDIDARLGFVLVKNGGDFLDRLVVSRVRAPENHENANSVLVDVLPHQLGIQAVTALLADVEDARLDFKVARKLLQRDLGVGAHDDVRLRRVLAFGSSLFLPAPLHGEAAEVDGFGGTGGRGTDGFFARLHAPEVRDDGDAARVHVHHGWVLVRVGHVFREIFDHEGFGFALDVGSYEAAEEDVSFDVDGYREMVSVVEEDLAKFRLGLPSRSSSSLSMACTASAGAPSWGILNLEISCCEE